MFKSYLPYLSAAVLLILAGIIMFQRHGGTLQQEITDFLPRDFAAVDQVSISRGDEHMTLQKKSGSWELQSSGKAEKQVIDFFFTCLQRFEIVSPASRPDREEIKQYLLTRGKMVAFYNHNKMIRKFYIGYDTVDVKGTYIMNTRRKFPYRVKLKGYGEVNMENLFSLRAQTWLQKEDTARYPALKSPGDFQKKH